MATHTIRRKPVPTTVTRTLPSPVERAESPRHGRRASSISSVSSIGSINGMGHNTRIDPEVLTSHGQATVVAEEESNAEVLQPKTSEKFPRKQRARISRSRQAISFCGPWSLEFWSMVLAWIAFAAIVVVLVYYDKKPQERWPYKALTLNGLLALPASISRASLMVGVAAALGQGKWNWFVGRSKQKTAILHSRELRDFEMFDEASRGAWGSILLLCRRFGHLSSLGAILTVLLLGFDTFAQQIVAIYEKPDVVTAGNQLIIPRSEYYDSGHFLAQNPDFTIIGDLSMESGVYNGIMNQNLTELPISCPTGTCDWPIIPTVEACGTCVDMTPNITRSCTPEYCNYTLPNNVSLDGRLTELEFSEISARRNLFQLWSPFESVPYTRQWSNLIPELPYYIAIFQSMGALYRAVDLRSVNAAECALYLCLRAYNVSVRDGRPTTRILATHTNASANGFFDYNFTSIPFSEFNIPPDHSGYGSSKASLEGIGYSFNQHTFGSVKGFQLAGPDEISGGWSYNVSSRTVQAFWQASA